MQETESGTNTEGGLDALLAKTFSQQQPEAAQAPVTQTEQKPEQKQAEVTKPEAEKHKPTSIFDTQEPKKEEKKSEAKEAPKTDDDPFAGVKENDWKAAKAAAKERQQAALAQLEAERKAKAELAAEREALKAELAKYHEKLPDLSEVDKLKAERDAYNEKLRVLDYKNHPDFVREYVEPRKAIVSELSTILADADIKDVDLVRITELPRKEFAATVSEISGKLNEFDAVTFREQIRKLASVTASEKKAVENASLNLQQIAELNKVKQRKAFESVFSQDSLPAFAKEQAINENDSDDIKAQKQAFNQSLSGYREEAERAVFGVSSEEDAARLGIEATNFKFMVKHAFPLMQAEYKRVAAERDAAIKRIQELEVAKPKDGFDKGGKPVASKPKSLDEAIAETFKQ